MTLHPEILQKAQAEMDAVVGRSRLPNFHDRPNLPYLESVTVCDMCHVLVTPEEGHRSTGVRHQTMWGNALVDGSCEWRYVKPVVGVVTRCGGKWGCGWNSCNSLTALCGQYAATCEASS